MILTMMLAKNIGIENPSTPTDESVPVETDTPETPQIEVPELIPELIPDPTPQPPFVAENPHGQADLHVGIDIPFPTDKGGKSD